MRSTSRILGGFAVVAAVLGVGMSWVVEAQDGSLAAKARAAVARATGVAVEELHVVNEAPFRATGIRQFKLMDARGDIHGVELDAAGRRVDGEETKRRAREDGREHFVGKLSRELHEHLRGRKDGEIVNVISWLNGVSTSPPQRGDGVDEQTSEASIQLIEQEVEAAENPFVAEMQSRGAQLRYRARGAPMSAWHVPAGALRQAANQVRHDALFFLEREHQPRLNISRVVVGANTLNARGLTGTGRRVAVVESGRIADHANLPAGQRANCSTFFGTFAGVSGHKTNVAGVVQSTNLTTRGMAPGITIVDGIGANFSDSEMTAATDCVIASGVDAVNMSFGTESNGTFGSFARFVDRKIYNTGVTIVPAISNVCANRMGSPEIGFNVLAVGAFGDSNTTSFADDVAACSGVVTFSAFLQPLSPSGDRVKPDVVAPGHLINTTTSAGGFANANGTSFAAPHVAALVGLLTQRNSALRFQAERVRAIVMAAARHNITGASRLSARDGAGAIMMAAADGVLLDGLSSFFSTPGGTSGFPIDRFFTASAGQRVRVAIAWSHKSPGGDTLTRPTTDLDLTVRAPNGTIVASSLSFDNSYEIVDFTAPATGTYRATINNFRSSTGTEFIGFAASRVDF